ncbi:MAG: helicase HerA domain-containing protein, partial [Chloroflexota bacterium]
RASEVISQALLENLPGLNQGEVVVLGRLTRIPAMVRVAGRHGAEGGADINLVQRFEQARAQALATQVVHPSAPPAPVAGTARVPRKEVKLL